MCRGILLLLLGLLAHACTRVQDWTPPDPLFPPRISGPVTLPIRDPLVNPDLSVPVRLASGANRTLAVWMKVDSGSTLVALTEEVAGRLMLQRLDEDVRHVLQTPDGVLYVGTAIIPEMRLGRLRVTRVAAAVRPEHLVLGQSLLSHSIWEVNWDKGTLVLDPEPWSEMPDLVSLPLSHHAAYQADFMTARVDAIEASFLLDTGAPFTAVPAALGRTLPRAGTLQHFDADGPILRPQRSARIQLGPLDFGLRRLVELPDTQEYGILGLDLLARYNFQVIPGKRLLLRPRSTPWAEAKQRVSRWRWTRGCQSPGCFSAILVPAGEDATLKVEVERAPPYGVVALFGCESDSKPPVPLSEVLSQGGSVPGGLRHIEARIAQGVKGRLTTRIRYTHRFWFSRPDACRTLSIVDVYPLDAEARVPLSAGITL